MKIMKCPNCNKRWLTRKERKHKHCLRCGHDFSLIKGKVEFSKEVKSQEELEQWQKESKIYEIDFKGKIYIRKILSKEEFQKEFDKYIKKILQQLEEDYYITGSKFSNKTKFHKIKLSKKYDNWRVLLTKTTKLIKNKKEVNELEKYIKKEV